MFRVINDYLSKVQLSVDNDTYNRMDRYLKDNKKIKKHSINVSFNNYIVDITLSKFSVEEASKEFKNFSEFMTYDYSSMFVRYNEGDRVRYRFVTCREDKKAIYMDVIFS
ncbi:MAG: hypothetical protein IJ619_05170 [Eubacterium sp.]|nr:hypothetical protein [Eubacterium sp.]MCR5292132.1 hypothetical protein [Eubacterium sp.]